MKALYAFAFVLLFSFAALAQPEINLQVSVPGFPFPFDLQNGDTQASPFDIPEGTVRTFTFTIQNKGTSDLTLSMTGGVYISLTGSAASEVVLDESGVNPVIPASSSTTFTVSSKATTAPGPYSLTLSIVNDDSDENPYTGTVTYNISAATSVVSAESAGISISPNPSTDGRININGNVIIDKVIVYGLNGTSEEFAGAASFHTTQKGMLIVHVYTNKGIVAEKIRVQ
ncbi:MAG: hypothetical protein JWM14_1986 [Chitinophagaceae bacterium]|nr:hypothetical protein [Chitinophagaceae bacterium]